MSVDLEKAIDETEELLAAIKSGVEYEIYVTLVNSYMDYNRHNLLYNQEDAELEARAMIGALKRKWKREETT